MNKPDFKIWAENIVLMAHTYGTAYEEIERALEQSYDQGYHLGLNQGWAIEQDKEHKHTTDGLSYMSAPPKYKCTDCGEFYETDMG